MAKGGEGNNGNGNGNAADKATKRSRWATRKLTVKSSGLKRISIIDRIHKRTNSTEKKRQSGGSNSLRQEGDNGTYDPNALGDDANSAISVEADQGRTLYFNQQLPNEWKDEEGHPLQHFTRNKIRTAKYTPLSFVPKNLWFQFHNIANIFFLFLVILVIFPIFGGTNPGLNAVPLIFIVVVTAVKDAVEDYRRTVLDIELNNAPVHRLVGWNNVNVEEDNVSMWRKTKKTSSKFFGAIWHAIEGLWKKKPEKSAMESIADPRPSVETHATRRDSIVSPRTDRTSFISAREDIQMSPMTSPLPRQDTLSIPAASSRPGTSMSYNADEAETLERVKGDLINHSLPTNGGARFHRDHWKNIQVGDFVRLYNDDELPADIVVLSTSDADGACYVETKNLDGETNLKVRQALRCGRSLKHAKDCERAQFVVESEAPQPNLYKYNGAIKWAQKVGGADRDMTEPITIDNMLLRGCNMRNTDWILGIVVFTGHDTKIMMNAGVTPSKRARIARELNFNVICNFGVLAIMCLIAAVVNGIAWGKQDASVAFFDFGSIGGTAGLTGFITFWAALIVFQNLVPISLYITLEIVRTLQAVFIYSDVEMYYEKIDHPCVPKSWNISDDLGQIEYIFSDKTGTLTQNVMEFKKATINGQPYGEAYTEAQAGMQKRLGIDVVAEGARARKEIAEGKVRAIEGLRKIHDNPFLHDDELTFIAPDFVEDLANREPEGEAQRKANEHFFLVLALCHTVISEHVPGDPPKIVFKAQSPDEAALVATARDMGFTVLGSTHDGIKLNVMGKEIHYSILNTIEFNSSRKRMSAIVKFPDGSIRLLCKGADSVIYSRLKRGEQSELRKTTAEHLEMFAREGLRTLCIAERVLSESEYLEWRKEHDKAATALQEREEKLEEIADKIERELTLLGGTAIEDRLQDGVPDTIAVLADAGIKLWVLTGDKVETAINIGFSCNLLNNDMELIHPKVDEDETGATTDEEFLAVVEKELDRHLQLWGLSGSDEDLAKARREHGAPAATHALIIDGFTLRWVLHETLMQKFLLLCKQCKSVLCCRVSPAQKAAVVSMVKSGLDVMTLSIGDGANDVAMIQEADVGVGIAGEEGRQAVMSSDYAIGQFRFLQRLVLIHGRWSYRRLAETISNFFYKNLVWTFSIFWYQCFADFDITYVFEYTYILMFNLLFTSVPIVLMGVLDQDVSDTVSLAVPQLYRRGIERLEWTQRKFWLYMLDGLYQSIMCFFIPYLTFISAPMITGNGLDVTDRTRLGCYIAHPAVLTINLYILINTYRWDWLMVLVVVLSSVFIFFWTGVYSSTTYSGSFYQAGAQVYSEATFWAVFFITPTICILPRYGIKAIQKVYYPYDVDIIREQVTLGMFNHLDKVNDEAANDSAQTDSSQSSATSNPKRHQQYPSVDEDRRPIYPPTLHSTTTHNPRSQNGSDGTNYTRHEPSTEIVVRPSLDRVRPSYDRMRASMDRVRPSYEQSNEFTSAAMLSRYESTRSGPQPEGSTQGEGIVSRIRRRTRGKSIRSPFAFHKDNHITEQD